MSPYRETNLYYTYLLQVEIAGKFRSLDNVLRTLGVAIGETAPILDSKTLKKQFPGHEDLVMEQGVEIIDSLLGAAMVSCQTHISHISNCIFDLQRYATEKNQDFPFQVDRKYELLSQCSRAVAGSNRTQVELINAAANFFKHQSEWGYLWKCLRKTQQFTADVLIESGIEKGGNNVLRESSRILGNSTLEDTMVFSKIVWDWHEELEERYRRELSKRGLILEK